MIGTSLIGARGLILSWNFDHQKKREGKVIARPNGEESEAAS